MQNIDNIGNDRYAPFNPVSSQVENNTRGGRDTPHSESVGSPLGTQPDSGAPAPLPAFAKAVLQPSPFNLYSISDPALQGRNMQAHGNFPLHSVHPNSFRSPNGGGIDV